MEKRNRCGNENRITAIESKQSRTGVKNRGAGKNRKQRISLMIPDTSSLPFRDTSAIPDAKCSNSFTRYDEITGERFYFPLEDIWEGLDETRRWNINSLKESKYASLG